MSRRPLLQVIEVLIEDDGEEVAVQLPARFDVCTTCEGRGTHVNRNIDGNGITASEWAEDWDEDSRESYMRGDYDVACEECNGDRVVLVVDEEAIEHGTEELKTAYSAYCRQLEVEAQCRAEEAYERRMCGGDW